MFFRWRQDDETGEWWQGDRVTRIGHHEWFVARVRNPLVDLWVFEVKGFPVGQVRIDSNGEISFSVDKRYRGRGYATVMLKLACLESQWQRLKASVDETNQGGVKSLKAVGFEEKDVTFLRWHP